MLLQFSSGASASSWPSLTPVTLGGYIRVPTLQAASHSAVCEFTLVREPRVCQGRSCAQLTRRETIAELFRTVSSRT